MRWISPRWISVRWIHTDLQKTRHDCLQFLSQNTDYKKTTIPLPQLFDISYVRSSGSGGQKVNKTSNKLVISMSDQVISTQLKQYVPRQVHQLYMEMQSIYKRSSQGGIVISSDSHRSRAQNLNECFNKFLQDLQRVKSMLPAPLPSDETIAKHELIQKRLELNKKLQKNIRKSKKENRKKISI